jgi:hypothetical protein
MADQDIRIRNMPDSGSQERVAYDLYMHLRPSARDGQSFDERKMQILDLYADCLKVVKSGGYRLSDLRD